MNDQKFVSWEDAVTWLIDQPDRQDLVRQCYFDRPVLAAVKRYATDPEWLELSKLWIPKQPGKALDLGAGNGIVSYALAKQGWEVTALEPDGSHFVGAGAIRSVAETERLNIQVIEEWGESIPCPDNHFDLVMARQVVHHAHDLEKMYAEMARILKPGGRLIAFRDHLVDDEKSLEEFRNHHPLHNLYGGENAFSFEQYNTAIKKAGLTIENTLFQFDSVINYAPKSKSEILSMMVRPLRFRFLTSPIHGMLSLPPITWLLFKLANRLYRRPGRLVSFICRKA